MKEYRHAVICSKDSHTLRSKKRYNRPQGPNYIIKQIMHPEDAYKEANSTKATTEETDSKRANHGEKEYKVAKGNYGP